MTMHDIDPENNVEVQIAFWIIVVGTVGSLLALTVGWLLWTIVNVPIEPLGG